MSFVLASLVPVFLLIATGWATRVTRAIDEAHWAGFERVTYFVLFPALITETLARADLRSTPILPVAGSLLGAIAVVVVILFSTRRWMARYAGIDGPSFTCVVQGATRWNTFVALAMAASLHGRDGTTLTAVAIASMIPVLNVLAVTTLSRYATARRLTTRELLATMARNPFIWSCALGLSLNVSALPMPSVVLDYAEILGRASLAAGLLVVGAGLDLARLKTFSPAIAIATALKLVVLPCIAAVLAHFFGVTGTGLAVTVLCTAVPTASGSYMLARQMGGNAPLMAEILTVQTLLAMATMPVALALLG
jgi:malonate transporter